MIAHVVLFKPKVSVTDDERGLFARTLQETIRDIPAVRWARVGRVAGGSQTGAFELGDSTELFVAVLEFADKRALDDYLAHPKHAELARLFWLYTESNVILDVPVTDPKIQDLDRLLL
jgi:hypothetical protein